VLEVVSSRVEYKGIVMLVFVVKFLLAASAIIVIILVMLQRGKGGGLAGALGGMGGQSAFGTKAGDLFTKITIGVASFWIVISILTAIYAPRFAGEQLNITQVTTPQVPETTLPPSEGKPADSGAGKAALSGGTPAAPGATEKVTAKNTKPNETPAKPPAGPAEKLPEKSTPASPASSGAAPSIPSAPTKS
jgi:preprotein translocase subunit SecG